MTNCSPKKDPVDRTLSFTYSECPPPQEGPAAQITLEFDYIEPYWFEVRPPDNGRKTIQNGRKQEKLKKTTVKVPDLDNPENADGDTVNFIDKVYYQPEYEIVTNSDEEVTTRPVYRRYCKADISYDEQYFYHIFEWPLSHTLPPRPAGGITVTQPPPTTNPDTGASEESCPVYAVEQTSVSGTFSLAKVDSAVENVPTGSVVYHGGTDDNKIFFFYENTSNRDLIAVGDVINGWTVDKVVNYNSDYLNEKSIRTTESVRRRVSKLSEKNKTPGYIFINKNDTDSTEDREVNVGDLVKGYGIQPGTTVTQIQGLKIFLSKPLKYKKRRKVRNVKFIKTDLVNNISNRILCYAELSGSGSDFVKDNFYSKDTPSTPQYTSFVYHVFGEKRNRNIQLSNSRDIRVQVKNENDEGGTADTDDRRHYLVTFLDGTTISAKSDVSITITDDQSASGNEKSFNFVSKIEVVDSSSFKVWFKRNDNKNNTYVRGWNVTRVVDAAVIPENRIQVIAGKGIIDRSAVCGVYISNDKKIYSYTPLFYRRDNFCNPTFLEDDLGEYLLGDVTLTDQSVYIQQKFLCIAPLTDEAYQINNIFWTYFGRPAEQGELADWVSKVNSSNFVQIQEEIINTERSKLGTKSVLSVRDSECDNVITSDYTKVYYPHVEFGIFDEYLEPLKEDSQFDDCVDVKTPTSYTKNELNSIITSNLEGSFNFSSISLPQEMYKRVVSNEDSLQNMLLRAINSIGGSIPKETTIPNLPPSIEGEDNSGKSFTTTSAYRIPPRFKSLEYVVEDFSFVSDASLDPESEENKITIKLKSIPRWTGNATFAPLDGLDVVTNKDANNYVTSVTVVATAFASAPLGGSKGWAAGPKPDYIWQGDDYNYQVTFNKILNFRANEVTKAVANAVKNKGNPYMDEPPYARLTQELKTTDSTIKVDDTSQFTSSGYIIIPKYIVKKEVNAETRNETLRHYYFGEEIIYYKDKTETEFLGCTRQMFDTTYSFEESLNSGFIEEGLTYIIKTLGSVNWSNYGAPSGYGVGTIFTAKEDGSGTTETGEVYLFGSTMTPFDNSDYAIHSYQKNNYLSQYWPVEIQNKSVS